MRYVQQLIARPLIRMWLATSAHSWQRQVAAKNVPRVQAPGINPARVLFAGDGVATGRGVRDHELGLSGYLARSVSALTGRATDVDIVVDSEMTAATCQDAMKKLDLLRFDVIVLSLGANEALALADIAAWRTSLRMLLDDLEERSPEATRIFLLSIPFFSTKPHFPVWLAKVVDHHVGELNAVMQELAGTRPRVRIIPLALVGKYEPEGPHLYKQWADGMAGPISVAINPAWLPADDAEAPNEPARQQALDDMHITDAKTDPVLDNLTESARRALGTPIAAITIIDGDMQLMKAASGIDANALPRKEAFCDMTIRQPRHLIIDDASADRRYATYSLVTDEPHIRFYAGYPIESPGGQRIGALCVMDTTPRQVTSLEIELLRTLAQYVQEHLWRTIAA